MPHDKLILVEGDDDKVFLDCVLQKFCIQSVGVERIGGGIDSLHLVRNKILRAKASGRRVFAIFYTDTNFEQKYTDCLNTINTQELPIEDFFLIPNGHCPGDLETLLQGIASNPHDRIYDCLVHYEECIHGLNEDYRKVPMKGKVYAYCEALGIAPKPSDRNYLDLKFWNLDAEILLPLRNFLAHL